MLKVGGENVAAAEVEAILDTHEAVELSQVIGIPDERLAEVPAAFVKLANGMRPDETELIALRYNSWRPLSLSQNDFRRALHDDILATGEDRY